MKEQTVPIIAEDAMEAVQFIITMTLLRLVIPFGLVLLVGTWVQRAQALPAES